MKHTNGGPEASRLTATARKKLTALGIAVDALRDQLEGRELLNVYVTAPWESFLAFFHQSGEELVGPKRSRNSTQAQKGANAAVSQTGPEQPKQVP